MLQLIHKIEVVESKDFVSSHIPLINLDSDDNNNYQVSEYNVRKREIDYSRLSLVMKKV